VSPPAFPQARWLALAWLAVYLPSYTWAYGPANFLFLCNVAVILFCVGLWRGSALLVSVAALSSLVIDIGWLFDFAPRLVLGRHLFGGTEYMWDPRWPLFTRLLSLYHLGLPLALVLALRRLGYDRRALWVQSSLALVALALSRLADPQANINYAHFDPFLRRSWGPAPMHLARSRPGGLLADSLDPAPAPAEGRAADLLTAAWGPL
jgi:hypothetical protein